MTSFQMPLSDKDRIIGRSIYKVQKSLAHALMDAKKSSGMTQQKLAKKLGVNRSVINRRVTGQSNLTLYSMAELAWALGLELSIDWLDAKEAARAARTSIKPGNVEAYWVRSSKPAHSVGFVDKEDMSHWFELLKDRSGQIGFSSPQNDNAAEHPDGCLPEAA